MIKHIFGLGPIEIRSDVDDEPDIVATFNYYIKSDISITYDIVNAGAVNDNGYDMSRILGIWMEFDLELVDPDKQNADEGETAGGGENILKFLQILNATLNNTGIHQYFKITPAVSDGTSEFRVKIIGNESRIKELIGRDKGHSISIRVKTWQRTADIPIQYSVTDDIIRINRGVII